MRPIRVVARAFVYGTEDEERVVEALLRVLGRPGDAECRGRLTRSRIKGHYGTQILLLEGVQKRSADLRACFQAWRGEPDLVRTLQEEFSARLDEDRVLHFRFDKQAAVQGRLELGREGDTINVEVKYEAHGEATVPTGFPFG